MADSTTTAQIKIQTQPQTSLYANHYNSAFNTVTVKTGDKITLCNETEDYKPVTLQSHELMVAAIEPNFVTVKLLEPNPGLRIMSIALDETGAAKVRKYYDQDTREFKIGTGKSLTLEEPETEGDYHICWWLFVEKVNP